MWSLTDSGHYAFGYTAFNYTLNTTICSDGTICPFPNNQTCCNNGQGIHEINFHNDNILPNAAADLSTYYAAGVYTDFLSTQTSSLQSTSFTAISTTATTSSVMATPTHTAASASPTASTSISPSLSTGTKAGIGVGTAIGACIIGALLYLLFLRKGKRSYAGRQADESKGTTRTVQHEAAQQYHKPELTAESSLVEMDALQSVGPKGPSSSARVHEI